MNNCKKCGGELKETDKFCINCGETVVPTNINNQQNSVNQQNFANPQNNSHQQMLAPKKNNAVLISLMIVIPIVLIVIGVLAFIIIKINGNLNYSDNNSQKQNNVIDVDNNSNKNNKPTVVATGYKVNHNNFELTIPDNYIYRIHQAQGIIEITDAASSWQMALIFVSRDFELYKQNIEAEKQNLVKSGAFTLGDHKIIVEEGREYLVFPVFHNGSESRLLISKINNSNMLVTEYMKRYGAYDDLEVIKALDPIAKSIVFKPKTDDVEFNIPNRTTIIEQAKKVLEN